MFYCAAQILRQGFGNGLYDPGLQIACQSKLTAVPLFYNHPPYEALLYVPLTYLPYRSAFVVWTISSVALLSCSVLILTSETQVRTALSQVLKVPTDYGLVLALCVTFAPVTTCLLLGQNSMVTLFIHTGAFSFFHRGNRFWSGCLLGLALFKFQLVLPIVIVLLLRRQWPFVIGFFGSALVLVIISCTISGIQVVWTYPQFLLFESRHPELAGFRPEAMPNMRGVLARILNPAVPGWIIISLTVIISTAILAWAAQHWRGDQPSLSFSIAVLATLLVSFHLYNYDLALLLLPAAILVTETLRRGTLLVSKTMIVSLLILFANPLHYFLLLHSMYTAMCIPILCLFICAIELMRNAVGTRIATGAAQS